MPIELAGFQALASVISLALWVSKAENAPKEVARCLELIRLIYKDTQYLIELRNESLSLLEQTPRELRRIDDVIVTATRSLQDLGAILEKYRPEAHGGRTGLRSRVVWVLADSETFTLRAPNLMTQHSTVLSEVQMLRNTRAMKSVLEAASKVERAEPEASFENVGLLHLPAGSRPGRDDKVLSSSAREASLWGAPSQGTYLSPPSAEPRRPLTPTYDSTGHTRQRAFSHSPERRLRPQPSLASLFNALPPPYSRSASPVADHTGGSDSSSLGSERTESADHLRNPLILIATVPQADPVRRPSAPQYHRSSTVPETFVGLKALLSERPATLEPPPGSPDIRIHNAPSLRHSAVADLEPVDVHMVPGRDSSNPGQRLYTSALSVSSAAWIEPVKYRGSLGTLAPSQDGSSAAAISGSTPSTGEGILHHSTDSTAPTPELPLHLRLSELFGHKAVPAVTVQPLIHELGTGPPERQTLFELEAPVPAVTVQPLTHKPRTRPPARQALFELEAPAPAGYGSAAEPDTTSIRGNRA